MGRSKLDIERIHNTSTIGIVNGLYANNIGNGGIIRILIYKYNGGNDFSLHLTGSQGNVMKESVKFSYTVATNILKDDIITQFITENPHGLHIHTPDGSTKKDGPSAGITFAIGIVSFILKARVRHNYAMTGEINSSGEINKIGGLIYKLRGAKIAGVNKVFIPCDNNMDLQDIVTSDPNLIDSTFSVSLVDNIRDILSNILVDDHNNPINIYDYLK